MKEDIAIEALKQVKEVFDEHDIEYWLDTGILLGAVRDRKIIPWDGDVDFGVWYSQISKLQAVPQELCDKGFEVHFLERQNCIKILKKDHPIDATFDVTLYRLNNGKAMHTWFVLNKTLMSQALGYLDRVLLPPESRYELEYSCMPAFVTKSLYKISDALPTSARTQLVKTVRAMHEKTHSAVRAVIPSHYFTNLSTIRFYGMEFKVPAKTEEYLAYRYGEDWRVPKKDYTWYKEDGAICR